MEKVVVKLNSKSDLKEFMECVMKLKGPVRAVQGINNEINVDAKSTLGIASIMENGTFRLMINNCISGEKEMFTKWTCEQTGAEI